MLLLLLTATAFIAFAQSKPIPQLVKKGARSTFMVDGKPFLFLEDRSTTRYSSRKR